MSLPAPYRAAVRFALVALLLTWMGWLPLVLRARGLPVAGGQWWHFVGSLGPLAAAILLVAREEGAAGCARLDRRVSRWPGGGWLDLGRLGTSKEFPTARPWVYVPAAIVLFGFGEEVGWRGYLIPRLQERLSPRHAALAFVPFWALWHLPLFLGGTNLGTMGAGAVGGWIGSLLVGSALLSWLYNAGRGSVLPAALFHGLLDVVFVLPDPRGVFPSITGALVTIWGVGVLALRGPWGLRDLPPARVP